MQVGLRYRTNVSRESGVLLSESPISDIVLYIYSFFMNIGTHAPRLEVCDSKLLEGTMYFQGGFPFEYCPLPEKCRWNG